MHLHSLTSQQVKYSYAKGGGEASAEAGTEPSQSCQHHQTQGHQWQQKLAPPQVYTHTQKGMSLGGSPDLGQCIIQHHILVIINAQKYSFMNLLNKGKVIRLNLQVRSMSSPLLWFPGSLYFGVNCWGRVKLRHSSTILASERGYLHNKKQYLSKLHLYK